MPDSCYNTELISDVKKTSSQKIPPLKPEFFNHLPIVIVFLPQKMTHVLFIHIIIHIYLLA